MQGRLEDGPLHDPLWSRDVQAEMRNNSAVYQKRYADFIARFVGPIPDESTLKRIKQAKADTAKRERDSMTRGIALLSIRLKEEEEARRKAAKVTE